MADSITCATYHCYNLLYNIGKYPYFHKWIFLYIPTFVIKNNEDTPVSLPNNEQKQVNLQEEKKFKNQQGSFKISNQPKEKPGVLMKLTNKKYAHEIINLLRNHYVENQLTSEQKKKFKLLTKT
ncbi:hypothetical protein [Bacillus pseudomycoides]|uniref:hypothetical protein n=1 Tax=Bacillus pseudomycoides TaxID=64104 RepID=UPI0020D25BCA|nr:hypothetical protein [Bacillus pseudomycoides]